MFGTVAVAVAEVRDLNLDQHALSRADARLVGC
jgi:hypothetical protein